jgi:ubiquinone/menaquinone biosynthesis C-methylase UbiE
VSDWRRYEDVAETYERVRAPIAARIARDLVALTDPPSGGRVLDVGTGTGVAAEAAAAAGARVVGVDRSLAMLAVGRRARPALGLAAAEAIQLPFPDGVFDVVLASLVLHELTRYDTALFDLLRVLRPRGWLATATWAAGEDELEATWRGLVEETVGPELVGSARQDAAPWLERFGDPARLEETLRDAGLRPVRVERRSYRFRMSREDYLAEQGTRWLGRFVRGMLGSRGWESFLERARRTFAERFGPDIEDTRDVLFAVGTKP